MGMAASQARFLSLTARKSNTEYQGQQVNQARTVLAQESSNIVAQMAALNVPTPPIQTDYSKMVYTFTDVNNAGATITDWKKNPDATSPYTHLATISHKKQVTNMGVIQAAYSNTNYSAPTPIAPNDKNFSQVADYYNKKHNHSFNIADFATVTDNNTNLTYYALRSDLYNNNGNGQNVDMILFTTAYENINSEVPVNFNEAGSGRFSQIVFDSNNQDVKNAGLGGVYNLGITKVSDDEGYDSAWNQYLYDKDVYEKKVAELNAKTDEIQAQDKTLELQLKQLDTEQEALTQEMEAVKDVIQKNVEKTFNTFA